MHRNSLPYKDTVAAPGSDLYKALIENDWKKAASLYRECQVRDAETLRKSRERSKQQSI